jgi:cysteine-rich repeat protein
VNTGANNLNNDDATDSNVAGLECAGGGSVNAERDVWAKWTATCSGAAVFDTCATPGAVSDTILGVYTGTCGTLTEVGCDEDSCVVPPAINDFNSRVAVSVVSGQQYFIRIASFAGSPDGPFVLTITCDASVVCGNGVLESGEQCDDGNNVPNDGCTNCTVDTPVFPCVGTPEGFPCRVDGDVAATDPNGGCNSSPPLFGSTITLGQTICGQTSTYINSLLVASRDTDWILFTPTVTGNYQIVMFAPAFTPQTGWLQDNDTTSVVNCPGAAFITGSAVGGAPGVPLISNAVLTANSTYAVFCGRLNGSGDVSCANGAYSVRVTFQPTP